MVQGYAYKYMGNDFFLHNKILIISMIWKFLNFIIFGNDSIYRANEYLFDFCICNSYLTLKVKFNVKRYTFYVYLFVFCINFKFCWCLIHVACNGKCLSALNLPVSLSKLCILLSSWLSSTWLPDGGAGEKTRRRKLA